MWFKPTSFIRNKLLLYIISINFDLTAYMRFQVKWLPILFFIYYSVIISIKYIVKIPVLDLNVFYNLSVSHFLNVMSHVLAVLIPLLFAHYLHRFIFCCSRVIHQIYFENNLPILFNVILYKRREVNSH